MFYDRVSSICEKRGISVVGMCKAMGLSTALAHGWKHGAEPRISTVKSIAEYLNVSVDYLKERVDEEDGEIPVALSLPKGYDKLTEEEREQIEKIIDMFVNRK